MTSRIASIWYWMRGYRGLYGQAIAALVVASCFMYTVPLVAQIAIDGLFRPQTDATAGHVVRAIAIGGGREYLLDHLWISASLIVGLSAIGGFFTYLRGRWSAMASEGVACRLRDNLYDHLQHLPLRYHDTAETGDLVQRCTSDVETFRAFLATQVVEIGRALLMLLVPIPVMLTLSVPMTLVSLAAVIPMVTFSYWFCHGVGAQFKEADEAEGRLSNRLLENLNGIRVVRAFHRQAFEIERFDAHNRCHRDETLKLFAVLSKFWSITDIMCMGQMTMTLVVGGYWVMTGELAAGTFVFFIMVVNMYLWPVRMLGRILSELEKAKVAIGRLGEIFDLERESDVAADVVPSECRGKVRFDDVSFHHGRSEPVIDGVSFEIAAGETVGLLGPSGAGKSTLIHLLLRLYDVDAGCIEVDDEPLSRWGRKPLRSRVASVLQEPFLYSKSLAENIRLGRSTADDRAIELAATDANIHGAICEFDQGYKTLVGERGVTLSGGQRQRVALARALIDDPAILVLDDALSAVDTETENGILDALEARKGKQTTLIVAHRLSTLKHCDRVFVIEDGRIVQSGPPDELERCDGPYRRVWRLQNSIDDELRTELQRARASANGRESTDV